MGWPRASARELGAVGGAERTGRLEQPGQCLLELWSTRRAAGGGQIPFDVLDGARQDIQLVAQAVEGATGDDQLLVPQRQLARASSRFVVTLAAGVAALVLSLRADLTRVQVRVLMEGTCDKIGSGYGANGHSTKFGFGRINAERALDEAQTL